MAALLLGLLVRPCAAQQVRHPELVLPAPGTTGMPNAPRVIPVEDQGTEPSRRPLPPQIESMPGVEEEMEVIHRRSQLIIARTNIVRMAIADPSIIDVVQYSPTEIAVIGLERGSTTLTLWFENSRDPLIYLVTVIRDPSLEERKRIDYGKLERKLALLFPNSKVYLIPLSTKIVVKGQARDAEEAAKILSIIRGEVINQEGSLGGPQPAPADTTATGQPFNANDLFSSYIVNMLEVPGEYQVMLRVRIAELNRSQLKQMGVDLNVLFNDARHLLTSSMGGIPSTLTGIFENGEINVLVNWLASNGTAKVLAEPTLTVLSGHSASFLSGSEFAVPTIVGVQGAQGTTTTFRGTGTSLIVTPTVVDRDLIRMRIVPEFSEVNQGNAVNGIPGVDSRRVQTTVELREGQTLVLAGLLSHQSSTEVTRIPFLGDLPWIGPALFNTKRATMDETELLVLVSPEIVRPMEPDEVPPVPGFYVTHPTGEQLFWRGMTEGPPDLGVYQLPPYGHGDNHGIDVGYDQFNPAPASPQYAPVPTDPYGQGGTLPPGSYLPPAGTPGRYAVPPQPSPAAPPTSPGLRDRRGPPGAANPTIPPLPAGPREYRPPGADSSRRFAPSRGERSSYGRREASRPETRRIRPAGYRTTEPSSPTGWQSYERFRSGHSIPIR